MVGIELYVLDVLLIHLGGSSSHCYKILVYKRSTTLSVCVHMFETAAAKLFENQNDMLEPRTHCKDIKFPDKQK